MTKRIQNTKSVTEGQSDGETEGEEVDASSVANIAAARPTAPSTKAAIVQLIGALKLDACRFWNRIAPRLAAGGASAAHGISHALSWAAARAGTRMTAWRQASSAGPDVQTPENDLASDPLARPVRRRRRRRSTVLIALVSFFLMLTVGLAGLAAWALHDVPLETIAAGEIGNQVIVLAAADDQPLIQRGPYQELAAKRGEFPDHLIKAVLAIEDRRFYDHWGVDIWSVGRALSRNLFAGEVQEGGSTITQQLLKVLYLEPDRTIRRKIQELFLSLWLESRLGKDEILTHYLNNIYLGAGATGMPAAARIYFDKAVTDLTLAESAMLAGLISAPSALNPIENLDGARQRASIVLQSMLAAGFLEQSAMLEAELNSAELRPRRPDLGTGTWFADWAMQEAQDISGQFRGSVKVTTTLTPFLQEIAEQSVRIVMSEQGASSEVHQAAMVVLAPDGAVLAMVGGLDYEASQFNRALALRQPGSTFKLFTYYAALKLGAAPDTPLMDEPIDIEGWTPENIDGNYSGRVSMAEAFARSLNAATVSLGMEVGLPQIVAAARELGIEAPLRESPSLILGASEVSLLDLTGAYASVRAGVAPVEPYGIKTFEAPQGRPFTIGSGISPSTSLGAAHAPMLNLLQLVVERGTGQAAGLDRLAAGKTGTSQDYRDAWFIGFDENYTVGVWVGNDDGTPMNQVTGGQLPATIWRRFMIDAVPGTDGEEPFSFEDGQPRASEPAPQCNIKACSRAYRSFRASDCTFQPYSGPRRMCEK